jgi:hypothetical protein
LTFEKINAGSWSVIGSASNVDPGATYYIDNGSPGVGGLFSSAAFGSFMDDYAGYNI